MAANGGGGILDVIVRSKDVIPLDLIIGRCAFDSVTTLTPNEKAPLCDQPDTKAKESWGGVVCYGTCTRVYTGCIGWAVARRRPWLCGDHFYKTV